MLLGALVNAATFGSFTFLAPVVTGTAGLGELWISVVPVLFGAGSFVGVTVAGRLSDQRPGLVITVGGPLLLIGWSALAMLADEPVALFTLVFVQGALSFALGSTLITRVLYEAAEAPTMAGSYATAALNVGAAVGPLIAATTLSTAVGDLGPLWASGLLVAVALLVAFPPPHCGRGRPKRRGAPVTHANAPLGIEGRRRLLERCHNRPIAHVAAEAGALLLRGTGLHDGDVHPAVGPHGP